MEPDTSSTSRSDPTQMESDTEYQHLHTPETTQQMALIAREYIEESKDNDLSSI